MEAARLASSRGDRLGAEQSLASAIAAAEAGGAMAQLAAGLIKLGELKRDAGSLAEAEELFGRSLEITDGADDDDDSSLVAALTNLAAMRAARGAPAESEVLLKRALAIRERRLGREHPDLVVLLNDLSRLYLKRSAYALAEPLLLQLHAIKRVKGEEHPEVATVLASLATVRQALGDHDAAEQLWRRVLAIRERTLAPNHFAIATAVEHLAETCSARGKVAEALRLYRRALAMREMTLGVEHPSLRASRELIADLQLQGEEFGAEDAAVAMPSASEWRPAAAPDHVAMDLPTATPVPMPARANRAAEAAAALQSIAATIQPATVAASATGTAAPGALPVAAIRAPVAPAPLPYTQPRAPEMEMPAWAEREAASPATTAMTRVPQPMAIVFPTGPSAAVDEDEDFDLPNDAALVGGRMHNISTSLGSVLLQRRTQVAAGVVAIVLVAAAASASLRSRSIAGNDPFVRSAPVQQYVAGGATALADTVAHGGATTSAGTTGPLSVPAAPMPSVAGEPARAESTASEPVRTRASSAPATAALPSASAPDFARLPGVSTAQLDSAMRAAASANVNISVPTIETPAFTASGKPLGTVNYGADPARQAAPRLIGEVPRVQYPHSLRGTRRERVAEVLVEFAVDTLGMPEMGTLSVVRSDDALLTDAVRKVIPAMRFVPAQRLGKKVKSKVQVPFTFASKD